MRKYQVVMGCLAILVLMAMLTGCPQEPEVVEVDDYEMPLEDEVAVGDPSTVGDLMAQWPSSFVMHIDFLDKETEETESATMTMMMGADGPSKMRMEMEDEAGAFVLDYEEMVMRSWDDETGQGMMMSLVGAEEDAEVEGVANPYGEVDADAPIVDSEVIDGVDCWVAEYVIEGEETARIWYAKDTGLVQRIESDTVLANYSYSDIGTVDASVFEVPEGIEMLDLSDLEGMMDMELE